MTALRTLLGIFLAVLLTAAGAQEFVPVPPLKSRVTDMVGMLDAHQRATLENVLKDYEDRTGSQIAVLLISKTEPEAIEQYSIRVYDAWQLGRKGVDDGVLLLVAKDNPPSLRRLRIEAGRGVQGSLTDAQSKRMLQDVIAPHFRQNDFYGGLVAGVSAITALLDKEKFPEPQAKGAAQQGDADGFDTLSTFLFIGIVILFLLLSRGRSSRRYTHGYGGWGRSSGIVLGGGFGSGGFGSGGGGFGGGFGGGGFSGGGGSADGGGASGNW